MLKVFQLLLDIDAQNIIRFSLHYDPRAMGIGVAKTFTHIDFLTIDQGEKYVIRPNVWKY